MSPQVTLALVMAGEAAHSYFAEAADLGVDRASPPASLTTDLGNRGPLLLRQVGPLIAHYVQTGGIRLSVLLDG